MTEEEENRYSVLFRVYQGGGLYSIPIQRVAWVEPFTKKPAAMMRSPGHVVGVYPFHGKNISVVALGCLLGFERAPGRESPCQNLLIIESTEIGFLVGAILGIETLCSRQDPGPLSAKLVQSVYSCHSRDELVLELDVPRLLSICS